MSLGLLVDSDRPRLKIAKDLSLASILASSLALLASSFSSIRVSISGDIGWVFSFSGSFLGVSLGVGGLSFLVFSHSKFKIPKI